MSNIALQIERSTAGYVDVGNNVVFDTTVYSAGNISYNNLTGVITFNEVGRYAFNWWVATQSSLSTTGAVFALSSSQGDFLEGNSPVKSGEVVGVGIIDVISAPVTLSLVNGSSATVYYSPVVPLTATLVIIQDDVPEIGPTGPTGQTGPIGPTGDTGPIGPTGDTGPGAIIPFASGGVITLSTVLGGLAGIQGLVGFGSNDAALIVGGLINTGGSTSLAFSAPRDGIITSMAACYSVGVAVALVGSTVTITAQLYSSTTPDDSFAPVVGATVTLAPPLTGLVAVGDTSSGLITGLSIPVTAGTRLMFVLSASVTAGIDIATMLNGYVSGGLSID